VVSGTALGCVGLADDEVDELPDPDPDPDVELGADPWKSTIDSLLICWPPLLMVNAFEVTV